jgi:hypothetical protein
MAPTTSTKLAKIFETIILSRVEYWRELLLSGDLARFEQEVQGLLQQLHGEIMRQLLEEVGISQAFKKQLKILGLSFGLSHLKLRRTRIQIGTGQWIEYRSYYAHQAQNGYGEVNRQLSHLYWGCVDRASPKYLSIASMMSVVCPSFEIARQVLGEQGIQAKYKRIRRLSGLAGTIGRRLGISAQLDSGEDLVGMRVVVQIDGGRSRMREDNEKRSAKGYQKYDTPWREPKLIAIHVLDEKGQIARTVRKPFYQAAIQDAKACMEDLVATLRVLKVDQAEQVQFLADGASFIWKRIRNAFKKAGVAAKKITYTLDYYHAVEHLKGLSELLPLAKQQRTEQFEEWKTWLWDGLANSIARDFKKQICKAGLALNQDMKTALNYFIRHHDRMQYKRFKRRKLLCGSGLVESAIRRVINLRFKGPSTFWCAQNLDKMFLLRCAMLSGRWHNLMNAIELEIKAGGTF